jgi:hypothetical protein
MKKDSARNTRRRAGICAYVGLNGGGKTLAAVYDTLPSLDAGRACLSTVRLLDWRNPRPCEDEDCRWPGHPEHGQAHPLWVPFTSWTQLLQARHCDVLMDEVTGVASSRSSGSLPGPVVAILQQLRRRDVVLRWTAPAWARAEVVVRECTQIVTNCRSFLAEGGGERLWRPRRLFRWRTFDAAEFGEFTDGVRERVKAKAQQWIWRRRLREAMGAYDTLADVLMVGTVTETGRCAVCGGRRSVPRCTCSDDVRLAGLDASVLGLLDPVD